MTTPILNPHVDTLPAWGFSPVCEWGSSEFMPRQPACDHPADWLIRCHNCHPRWHPNHIGDAYTCTPHLQALRTILDQPTYCPHCGFRAMSWKQWVFRVTSVH
jgi:hypothetical protein